MALVGPYIRAPSPPKAGQGVLRTISGQSNDLWPNTTQKEDEKKRKKRINVDHPMAIGFIPCNDQKLMIFGQFSGSIPGVVWMGQNMAVFSSFWAENASFKPPKMGVLKPITSASTGKKVEKWPRGAVFSPFPKISPPVRQK